MDNEQKLSEKWGVNPQKRILGFYSKAWKDKYGFSPIFSNFGMLGSHIKFLLDNYTELQIACLIIQHFNWYGTSGSDDFAHKRLQESTFPFEWIPKNSNAYRAFLQNTENVDFDKKETIINFLKKHL